MKKSITSLPKANIAGPAWIMATENASTNPKSVRAKINIDSNGNLLFNQNTNNDFIDNQEIEDSFTRLFSRSLTPNPHANGKVMVYVEKDQTIILSNINENYAVKQYLDRKSNSSDRASVRQREITPIVKKYGHRDLISTTGLNYYGDSSNTEGYGSYFTGGVTAAFAVGNKIEYNVTNSTTENQPLWIIHSKRDSSHFFNILIDDTKVDEFDTYINTSNITKNQIYKSSASVSPGTHKITLELSATKNASSSGGRGYIEGIAVGCSLGDEKILPPSHPGQNVSVQKGYEIFYKNSYFRANASGTTGSNDLSSVDGTTSFNDGGVLWSIFQTSSYELLCDRIHRSTPTEIEYAAFIDGDFNEDIGGQTHGNDVITSYRNFLDGQEIDLYQSNDRFLLGDEFKTITEINWTKNNDDIIAKAKIISSYTSNRFKHSLRVIPTTNFNAGASYLAGMLPFIQRDANGNEPKFDEILIDNSNQDSYTIINSSSNNTKTFDQYLNTRGMLVQGNFNGYNVAVAISQGDEMMYHIENNTSAVSNTDLTKEYYGKIYPTTGTAQSPFVFLEDKYYTFDHEVHVRIS